MADQRISGLPSGFSGIRTSDTLPIERGTYPSSANFKLTLGNIFDLAGGAVNNGEPPGTTPYSFPSLSVLANGGGSTGYVGIGTNAPTAALDVTALSGIQIRSTGTAQLRIAGSSGAIGTSSLDITHSSSAASILNRTSSKLSVTSAGNLGLGAGNTEHILITSTGVTITADTGISTTSTVNIGAPNIHALYVDTSNPPRGIVAGFSNGASTGQTGSQIYFHQGNVSYWSIGQPAGENAFAFWTSRYPGGDGTQVLKITSSGYTYFSTPPTGNNDTSGATTAFVKANVPGGSSSYVGGYAKDTTYQNTTGRAAYVSYHAFAQNPGQYWMRLYIWPSGATWTNYKIANFQDNSPNNSFATVCGIVPTGWYFYVETYNNSQNYFWFL